MLPRAVSALAVEPLMKTPDAAYVTLYVSRLRELTALRSIEAVKARLQRADPADPVYLELFAELNKLELQRRTYRDRIAAPS